MDVLGHSAPAGQRGVSIFFGNQGQKEEWILVDIEPERALLTYFRKAVHLNCTETFWF